MRAFLVLGVFALVLAGFGRQSAAQELAPNLVRLHNRIFDLRVDTSRLPAAHEEERPFVAFHLVPWLTELVKSDPVLKDVVVFMKDESGVNWLGPSADIRENTAIPIPDQFKLDGYKVRASGPRILNSFIFNPLDTPNDYFVSCHGGIFEPFNNCDVIVSYPPEIGIWLEGTFIRTSPWEDVSGRFDDVAYRMREIAYCLDVTDQIKVGIVPDALPEPDMAKFLADCKVKLTN